MSSSERGRYNFVYDNWGEGVNQEEALRNFLTEMKKDDRVLKMSIDCVDFQSEEDEEY